jgi:hypothetical protein
MGDIEVSGRYQLTSGRNGSPIWIANLRYKSNTGKGPFDVGRDEFGIASELPTGSGFWGLEPGVTFLMPSDPAVLFANLGYLYHASDEVNRTINGVFIGEVDPGDSINASLGVRFRREPALFVPRWDTATTTSSRRNRNWGRRSNHPTTSMPARCSSAFPTGSGKHRSTPISISASPRMRPMSGSCSACR